MFNNGFESNLGQRNWEQLIENKEKLYFIERLMIMHMLKDVIFVL